MPLDDGRCEPVDAGLVLQEIMEQLLIQQQQINAAVVRLHEELFDLRCVERPYSQS